MRVTILSLLLFVSVKATSQNIKPGQWRGTIHYKEYHVPFIFEIAYPSGDVPVMTLINGEERRVVSNVTMENDSLIFRLDPFDVEIRTMFIATQMEGVYKKNYKDEKLTFTATYGKPRISKGSIRPSPNIKNRWEITFSPGTADESKGVLLLQRNGDIVTGTIMTEVSDYRYFEGLVDGDSLKLTSFDGAHAFAFLGKQSSDGWIGKMIYDQGYEEPWIATYNSKAELSDPWDMVKVEPYTHKPYFELLSAGEGKHAIAKDKYEGKVLIIQLFGTWCPNSHDQTRYLVDWYQANKDKEVAILGASYEANYSKTYGLKRLQAYREMNQISYDLVLGGRLSKTAAAMPFPFMKQITAFPTLIILDKQGFVRHVHSYFNGPATGEYYDAFDKKFNEIITALLAEE